MSDPILDPGFGRGFYPERKAQKESTLDRVAGDVAGNLFRLFRHRSSRYSSIIVSVRKAGEGLDKLSVQEMDQFVDKVRLEARTRGLTEQIAAQIFALIREISRRKISLYHYDVQLIGGWIMLGGMVAEMDTGEGKTLTATLPAGAAALAGIPVHIVTVNDYLASRDAEWMAPVYEALGLTVGVIQQGMSPEDRRKVYGCDVVYCTNKELVFDFLKDRLTLGQRPGQIQMQVERIYNPDASMDRLLLRGLVFAVVDEADSVLVDEARTPLIISGSGDESYEAKVYRRALEVGRELEEDIHYKVDLTRRSVELNDSGRDQLMDITQGDGGLWAGRHRREELAHQALTAIHLFELDRDYIVRDNKVQIVDEYTGRVMADRTWEKGLHQLIEAKEECEISSQSVTMAKISYQRFFRRYLHLAGMTGTAREVTSELWSVYRLPVVKVPTNRPVARMGLPVRVHGKSDDKWIEIVSKISEFNSSGRPVLVGTRFVGTSEELSRRLSEAGIDHTVLNARQDDNEAQIISEAGQGNRVTVATNMAGRGTDISLGEGVAGLGGLHVLATELHDAGRIDRQLYGRCGRQGDPGSYESVVSLEDNLFDGHLKGGLGWLAARYSNPDSLLGSLVGRLFAGMIQRKVQNEHFQLRKNLLRMDEAMEKAVAFGGKGE